MRRKLLLRVLPLAAPFVTSFATAAAWALPFTATLTVQYTSEATLSLGASGTSVDGPAGAFDLPAGVFTGGDGPVNTPAAAPALAAAELRDVESSAGSFAAGAGTMALNGELIHFLLQPSPGFEIPIPLAVVGVGGTMPFSASLPGIPLDVTGSVTSGAWTTGEITVVSPAQSLMTQGFDARMLDGTGALRFVTPIEVELDRGALVDRFPGYAALDFVFTPEPGSVLLLGSGILALGLVRRRRPL